MFDSEIIELLTKRDERGLSELQSRFSRLIMKIALGVLGSRTDAEELVNDVLLSVWNAVPPENPSDLTAYICRIARRAALNRLRYNTAAKRNLDLLDELDEIAERVPSNGGSPEAAAEGKELAAAIDEWLDSLDGKRHRLFMLRYFYLQPVDEAAKLCGISRTAAASSLLRLRQSLKRFLVERGMFYE